MWAYTENILAHLQVATKMGLLQVLKDFAGGTSIHGLTFLVQPQLSPAKRVSWALLFIGALIYAGRQMNISVICKFGWFIIIINLQNKKYIFTVDLPMWKPRNVCEAILHAICLTKKKFAREKKITDEK